jgi:hypothetical protein
MNDGNQSYLQRNLFSLMLQQLVSIDWSIAQSCFLFGYDLAFKG